MNLLLPPARELPPPRTRKIPSTLVVNQVSEPPFQTNGIFHKATYNKVRVVHYIILRGDRL